MKKIKQYISIILIIWVLISYLLTNTSRGSFPIEQANLYNKGTYTNLLKKDGRNIRISYVVYVHNGKEYPAYCLDKTKTGVGDTENYSVKLEGILQDVNVWKAIINGYPYKTVSELGCESEIEAFAATKMAVYAVLYNYSVDQFSGIGEEGTRAWNALKQILENVKNSKETQISSSLEIKEENQEWELTKDTKHIEKTYQVLSKAPIQSYSVEAILGEKISGKIVDMNNNAKTTFLQGEKFKIQIPILELGEGGKISLKVQGNVETKPIFIGKAPSTNYQDYAITGISYEEGVGEKTVYYTKNYTKLKVIKQEENGTILEGAIFQLLDENKNVVKTNLITDKNGEIIINDILPGIYYLKEIQAPEGYQLYDEEITIKLNWNEELTIVVKNKREEIPEIRIDRNRIESTNRLTKKKLPKTGM